MEELATAKRSMNAEVREALEERPIFDPASLDRGAATPLFPPTELTDEELFGVDDEGESVVCWGLGPRAPWEVIP